MNASSAGRKRRNMRQENQQICGSVGKVAVLSGRANVAGGLTRCHSRYRVEATIKNEIHGAVEPGTQLYTDEHGAYSDPDGLFFAHDTVNHGAGDNARGSAHNKASRASGLF